MQRMLPWFATDHAENLVQFLFAEASGQGAANQPSAVSLRAGTSYASEDGVLQSVRYPLQLYQQDGSALELLLHDQTDAAARQVLHDGVGKRSVLRTERAPRGVEIQRMAVRPPPFRGS